MDIKEFTKKIKTSVIKYKYAVLVLVIGLVLLMLPGKNTKQTAQKLQPNTVAETFEHEALAEILQSVQGAGKVEVMLSVASGEETVYQTNSDISTSDDGGSTRIDTVIVTDSQRNETGLVTQVNPPTYLGAIVVCEGADSATVRLAITQAVAKITGLGVDSICVLKMK